MSKESFSMRDPDAPSSSVAVGGAPSRPTLLWPLLTLSCVTAVMAATAVVVAAMSYRHDPHVVCVVRGDDDLAGRLMHRGMHRADHEDASRAAMTSSGGSPLTTHVLDTSTGTPAVDLPITLYVRDSAGRKDDDGGAWKRLAAGNTNSDGKLPDMLTQDQFLPAIYKLHFNTAAYFAQSNTKGFFPYVEVVFEIVDPYQHYHVPLLLSPFGYTTYRGS